MAKHNAGVFNAGVFGAVLALALSCGPASANPSGAGAAAPLVFSGVYSVSAKGVEAGEFAFTARFAGARYEASATRRATGLVRALVGSSQDYVYSARGAITPRGLEPLSYEHSGGKRGRVVRVRFGPDDVVTTSVPAMGMGDPPATRLQKLGAMDQVSALAAMVLDADTPCQGVKRVFMDGRARFDFVMRSDGEERVRLRAYRGPALRCAVRFVPIAGFPDPQAPADMHFLFARTDKGVLAPLRIEMPTDDAGLAVLEVKKFSFAG